MPDQLKPTSQKPDWQEIVRQRLAGLPLDAAEKNEVHAELAAHLEESYEAFRAKGLSETRAAQRALQQSGNWRDLQHKIVIAKNGGQPMKNRLHQIWIPGLLSFALSLILLVLLVQLSFRTHFVSRIGPRALWLLSLPALGALAAYLSARAGGSRSAAIVAGLFPVLGIAFSLLFMFPAGFFLERVIGWQVDFRFVATDFLRSPIDSLLFPAAALLAGALPLQLLHSRRAKQPQHAS